MTYYPGAFIIGYSTKEALLVELMRRGVEMALTSSDDPVERLRLCINAHLRALLVDSDTVYVLLFEWRALGPEAREEIIELRDQYESLWAGILKTMIEQGVIQKGVDGHLLRLIGLGALNWVATWFDPKGAYTLDAIGDFIWQITIDDVVSKGSQVDTLEKLDALLPWNVNLEQASKKCRSSTEGKRVDLKALTRGQSILMFWTFSTVPDNGRGVMIKCQ